jgi:hypothetical protein
MVGRVVSLFAQIGPQIGLPHLIVLPLKPDLIPFYKDLGFEPYDNGSRMFLPVQSAIDAMTVAAEIVPADSLDAGKSD